MKKLKFSLLLTLFLFEGLGVFAQKYSFGIFTDVHYASIADNGTRKYSQSLDKVKQCIDTMNARKVGFVIELGDFKDMPTPPDSQSALTFLSTIEHAFSRFQGERFHVLGNHDEDCISKEQFNSIVLNSNISRDSTYYSFQKGGFKFIVLDACFDSTGHPYDRGNFLWSDANIPCHELLWLEKELKKTSLPTIVFVHQLLYGNSAVTIKNASIVREILENNGFVKCVFHGHDHKGGYEQINGIPYYTLKGLIEGDFPESNSFAVVTLTADKIGIKGFGNATSIEFLQKN